MTNSIFPIELSDHTVQQLFRKHFHHEHEKANGELWGSVRTQYFGSIAADGSVNIWFWASEDRGIQTAGTRLEKTFRPYDAEQLSGFVAKRKLELAHEEYKRRRDQEELEAVLRIHQELFGDEVLGIAETR